MSGIARRRRRWDVLAPLWTLVVSALALASLALAAGADEVPRPASGLGAAPQFRRVYVPSDQLQKGQWTQGYLPIDAEEFQRLVDAVQAGAHGTPGAGAGQIEVIDVSAQLVGEDLLVGEGTLQLARRPATPAILSLDPCSLAITAADWPDAAARPATLGTGSDGGMRLLVEGPLLHFTWSQRGERTASGAVTFAIELPGSPVTRLAIEAPAGLEIFTPQGIVTKTAGAAPKTTRWSFELGGHNRTTVRIASEDSSQQRRPLTLLRQALTYELTPRGINLRAQLVLDIHGEGLQRVGVDLDPGLQLVAARYGELQIPFSVTEDVETRMSHVVLQLPEPIVGTGRVLQLSAVAPPVLGKRWRLPGLRAEGMSWQEGTAQLLIPGSLVLAQLHTDGCRQSRTQALPAPDSGESIEVQFYRPGAAMEVLLEAPREPVKIDAGATVDVGLSEITNRTTLEFSLARGERRVVQTEVRAGWTIDAIEDPAAGRAVEWSLEDLPSGETKLRMQLDSPLTSESSVRLLVRGRRQVPTGPSFEAAQLEMLAIEPRPGGICLINVHGAEGIELRLNGPADHDRLDPLKLTPAESRLFAQVPSGLLFACDGSFRQSSVAIERRKASYAADVRIDAAVQKNQLTETFTIQCVPETSRVDRLLVRFSQAREAPLDWKLAGGTSGQFSARRLSAAEQTQVGLPAGGEAWELSLNLTRAGAFELRGVRSFAFKDTVPLALVSVAQASVQRGTLTIRSLADAGIAIKNRRLSAIPPELLEADRYQTARATYSYQPGRDDLGTETAVTVSPTEPRAAESGAWVWSHSLNSRLVSTGLSVQTAVLRVQTGGRQQVRLTLPEGAQLRSAWVDEDRLLADNRDDKSTLLVNLPPGRAFATISLSYDTADGLPALAASLSPRFVEIDAPSMAREWTIWLPPGYELPESPARYPAETTAAPTIRQRLFGPLGRDASSAIFNPLLSRQWRQLVTPRADLDASHLAGERICATLGALVTDYLAGEAETELTWGQLLALCGDREARMRRVLLIDAESLASLDVSPETRVGFEPGESPADQGRALLESAGLAVLSRPDVSLLVSQTTAKDLARELAGEPATAMAVAPGPMARELDAAMVTRGARRYLSTAGWQGLPDPAPLPWSQTTARDALEAMPQGWNAYRFQLSQSGEPSIRIARGAAVSALAWSFFLAALAFGAWFGSRRPGTLWLAGALAGAISVLLPAAFAPLAAAFFLGCMFCLAMTMTRLPAPVAVSAERHSATRSHARLAQPVATLLLIAAAVHFNVQLRGEPPASTPTLTPPTLAPGAPRSTPPLAGSSADDTSRASGPVHRVIVPVDDSQQPHGGKYYIAEDFYSQLYRQAALANGTPKGWLLAKPRYQGQLVRDPVSKHLSMPSLKAVFDLHVLQSQAPLRIPFPRDGSASPVASARLDGRPIALVWSAASDAIVLPSLPAGRYRLELELTAPPQTVGASMGIDLPIPAVAGAALELALLTDAPTIELPTARGQVRMQKEPARLQAQLGAAARLVVRWPGGAGAETVAANLEVEELVWVRVRPGTTVLDARFKYRVLEGGLRQIRLLADPRLRLLPSTSAQSPIAAVHTVPGDPQKIELELARTVSDQVVVDLSFLLTGTSSVGNLQFPRLESSGARASRRWLAVSVDPTLQSKELPGEDSKPIPVADFAAAWGTADMRPQAAYSIPRGQAMWMLSTQPSEPRTTVDQTLSVGLGRGYSQVELEARLSIAGGYVFQLGVEGPSDLAIETVSVMEDSVQRVARWSSDANGRTTVFLTSPITGNQRLVLRGRLSGTTDAVAVPRLTLVDAQVQRSAWRLYRQNSVLVEVHPGPGVETMPTDGVEPRGEFGALIGLYQTADPAAGLAVKIAPNSPQSKATLVTRLERDDDRWMAEVTCHVQVLEGIVDTLVFEVPPQWSEPYRVDPPAQFKLVPVPGETRRQLIVYPARPITDKYDLKIRGRVALSAGDRLRVPDVVPQRVQQAERFVVLPQQLDLQQITWETVGLSRAALPSDADSTTVPAESAVYQAVAERFQASLRTVKRAAATAQVRLANVELAWQADGRFRAVATYDLEPAGESSCVVELPLDCELLHVSVENQPAQPVSIAERRWRIPTGPVELPQRIEFVYTGRIGHSGARRQFPAPRLLNLRVQTTLWTIYSPTQFGGAAPADLTLRSTVQQQRMHRLGAIVELAQLPTDVVGEHLPEEIARWYRHWNRRYAREREALSRELTADSSSQVDLPESSEAERYDARIAAVDARLGFTASAKGPPVAVRSASDILASLAPFGEATRTITSGPQNKLAVDYARAPSEGWVERILLAIALAAVGVGGMVLLGGRMLPQFAPWSVLGLAGLGWWLWLAPSVVGLALVAIAGWIVFRQRGESQQRPLAYSD